MSKVYPKHLPFPSSSSSSSGSSPVLWTPPPLPSSLPYIEKSPKCSNIKEATFTVWMKSLLFNSSGCTVFDRHGKIIYRIDTYGHKFNREISVMDIQGEVLLTLIKKRMCFAGHWEGYRYEEKHPWFRFKNSWFSKWRSINHITVSERNQSICYKVEGSPSKTEMKIVEPAKQQVVAQVKKKMSNSGVMLGDDVLSLVVEPKTDPSLVVAIIVLHTITNHRM
ncbi:unnamed protein product [Victoria cruziana]